MNAGTATTTTPTVRDGIRAGLPLLLPTLVAGLSFGVVARSIGWGPVAPVVMSVVVFSGSAQFAAAGVLAAGGAAGAAIGAGTVVNLRFLPFGLAAAPALRGGPLRRAVEGQAVVDASIALAARGGAVSRGILLGSTVPQAAGWIGGTAIGALSGVATDPAALGIDAVFPAFFLVLVAGELRGQRVLLVAGIAALLTLALIPLVPPGLPVPLAGLAALAVLFRRR